MNETTDMNSTMNGTLYQSAIEDSLNQTALSVRTANDSFQHPKLSASMIQSSDQDIKRLRDQFYQKEQ